MSFLSKLSRFLVRGYTFSERIILLILNWLYEIILEIYGCNGRASINQFADI